MTDEGEIDEVARGREALAAADWAGAKAHFEAALTEAPADPAALDGLCWALFWLGDEARARETRERAYVEHRKRANARLAAAAALYVAADYRRSDNEAAWGGWLARAERCLEEAGVAVGAEHGAIEVERAKQATTTATKEKHARRALEIARDRSDRDLELDALGQMGNALVEAGQWEEGMALLDEAMAAATGGEASEARAICDICCQTLVACEQIADLRRASDWCRVVIEFTAQRKYTPLYAWCRSIYAGILTTTGEWDRAEQELLQALRTYESVGGVGSRVVALARLAELRLQQGRIEEAERLLADCEEHPLALVPVARLRLFRGDAATAAALLERRLAALPGDAPDATAILPVLVDARLAAGDLAGADAAAQRLKALGRSLHRDNVVALGELAAGLVAAARGRNDEAVRRLQRAVDVFVELGIPFEEGRARLRLAEVLAHDGSKLAIEEARGALGVFERLGAARGADQAAALLRSLGASGRAISRSREHLTAREREVLALLREGLTNAEIAERLVISEKTASHHVGRIFRKLGLRNRAEAAAYALQEGSRVDDA